MTALPTAAEMIRNADAELEKAITALEEAASWLRSDWRPVGSNLTSEQSAVRTRMFEGIREAKTAIFRAQGF